MAKQSAGLLVYRLTDKIEVLLVHPGGPFFARKDLGSWSVPKGEYTDEEEPLTAAIREFKEETGQSIDGNFIPLSPIKQKGHKLVKAWAVQGNIDVSAVVSNTFEMIWPPNSQQFKTFPEVDRAEWFPVPLAKEKINPGQVPFLIELENLLKS